MDQTLVQGSMLDTLDMWPTSADHCSVMFATDETESRGQWSCSVN